jgi:type II secretion system protein J
MKERGFTLIELMVSSALMAMILTAGYVCLQSTLLSDRMVEARGEMLQTARVALTMMSADLRSACPLSADYEFLGMDRMLGSVEADNLDFATHNYRPRRPHEGDVCEVSYYLQPEAEGNSYSLWRRRDATPDDDPFSGGMRERIAEGVVGLRLEYYDGYDWYDDWGDLTGRVRESSNLDRWNLYGMPEAVRITLAVEPTSRDSKRQEARETESRERQTEPPVTLQTVVRLNLAGLATGTASDESGSTATENSGMEPNATGGAP